MNKQLNENLLEAWLRVTITIDNYRLTSIMPFNESLVLRYLVNHQHQEVTATVLCNYLNLCKSQMNRILELMENKGLINRNRSTKDKRKIIVSLNKNQCNLYYQQHDQIMQLVDSIASALGKAKTIQTTNLLNEIAQIVKGEKNND